MNEAVPKSSWLETSWIISARWGAAGKQELLAREIREAMAEAFVQGHKSGVRSGAGGVRVVGELGHDLICNCGSPLDGSHDHTTCGPPIPTETEDGGHDAALAQSGGGGGKPDDTTLARLEKFKSGHKARACRISIDDGYGATCWAVELDVEGRGTVKASEAEMMRGGGDWPGLAAVINAALDTAEGVAPLPAGKEKP